MQNNNNSGFSGRNQDFDDDFYSLRDEFYQDDDRFPKKNNLDFLEEEIEGQFDFEENQGDDLPEFSEEENTPGSSTPNDPRAEPPVKDDDLKEDRDINDEVFEEFSQANKNSQAEEQEEENFVKISKAKLLSIKKLLKNIDGSSAELRQIINEFSDFDLEEGAVFEEPNKKRPEEDNGCKVLEGVFDGQNMIGPDGKQYSVPVNYASKSKLLEGDILKLTITPTGKFLYKQVGPIDRVRVVGNLAKNSEGEYLVVSHEMGRSWRILAASVSYFKGELGDEVIIFIPEKGRSQWAAVENIMKK